MSLCADMNPPWVLQEEVKRLTAENERLRAALEDVLSHTSYGDIPVTIYDNARAALTEEKA